MSYFIVVVQRDTTLIPFSNQETYRTINALLSYKILQIAIKI